MRHAIRLLVCLGASAALLASMSTPARAARPAASLWAAPTHLNTDDLRFGAFTGWVSGSRTGAGPGSASICMGLSKTTTQSDGSVRLDAMSGCQGDAKHAAYSFDPLRWKGTLSVRVPVERWSRVEHADGTVVETQQSPGVARVDLRWAGVGRARVRPFAGTCYCAFAYAGLTVTKRAWVSGTITLGSDVVQVTRRSGVMQSGGEFV